MNKFQIFTATLLLCIVTCTARAQPTTNAPTAADVKRDAKQAVNTTGAYTKEQLRELDKKADAQFHELGRKIDDLKAKAQTQTGQAKADLDKTIADAQKKFDDLKPKLKELKTATTNAWGDVQSAFDKGVDDLKQMLP
jgi:chromosome segregation ATPase